MKKTLLAIALPFVFVTAVHAQVTNTNTNGVNPLRFMVGIGLTAGGTNIATVQYTDGSSSNISSGTGVQLMVGVDYFVTKDVSLQASVGYLTSGADGSNGNASFDRYPVELLAYYSLNNKWRIGGGAQFISNPSLNGSGAGSQFSQSYKSTAGAIIEAEYFATPKISVKFRAVKETYTPTTPYNYNLSNNPGKSIDGSYFGIFGDYYF
jgi:outer membrane protein W